ncbi:MAG: erythromycin esterase family protein [Proteobacteria bacterium]|nr:erythromycin esterase family protein [Pseudomonadota bacterium]
MTKWSVDRALVAAVEKEAYPFGEGADDFAPIIKAAEDKDFVLIGEASHGAKEFYLIRAEITRRLIEEHGFDMVAVEADWPDAYTVNRYVCGQSEDVNANEALMDFERFPTWMWRNTEVEHFVEWLRAYNTERRHPVGFYGLDLYSMNTSIRAIIAYLNKVDPLAARRARNRYSCLDHFMEKPQAYGYATELGLIDSCESQIVLQLEEMRRKALVYMREDGFVAEDEYFCAVQNARLVQDSEQYYRSMFRGRPSSWNLRDRHMFATLEELVQHRSKRLPRKARAIVWAHNSHVGNAAATEMAERGEFNIGQLVRTHYASRSLLIGFSTCRGTVTAASNWDEAAETKKVSEPFVGSYEEVFHHVNHKRFFLDLRQNNAAVDLLRTPRLQRAIGVVYRPDTERYSHYFFSRLPEQFDFMIHLDNTTAVEPLATAMQVHRGEMDETYPSGI